MNETPYYYRLPSGCTQIGDITGGLPHFIASAMEYLFRADKKDPANWLKDYEKAITCIRMEIERREQENRSCTGDKVFLALVHSLEAAGHKNADAQVIARQWLAEVMEVGNYE